jgi:hypothetical protein
MSGKGRVPRDPSSLARRNKPPQLTVLEHDGVVHGPDLPDNHEWPQPTLDWWHVWRTSPQAAIMGDTDWCFMLETAVLHAAFWSGDRTVASELRQRVAKFGATPEDRARLRVSVGSPEAKPPVPVRDASDGARDSQRARLLKSVGSA